MAELLEQWPRGKQVSGTSGGSSASAGVRGRGSLWTVFPRAVTPEPHGVTCSRAEAVLPFCPDNINSARKQGLKSARVWSSYL